MNRTDNKVFYNPQDLGIFDIGITQVDKVIPFKSTAGVFIAGSKVEFYRGKQLVKSYTIGSGLVISGTNTEGLVKTLSLTLQGSDFSTLGKQSLIGKCTFFTTGDIEMTFNLNIIE